MTRGQAVSRRSFLACLSMGLAGPALAQLGRFVPLPSAVPELRVPGASGGTLSLEAHRGQVVVLNFWATWCVPCREELPALERLWRLRRDRGLAVIAVAIGEEAAAVRRFVDRLRPAPTFPIGLDRDKSVARAWKVRGLPTTVLVGRDGRAAFAAAGAVAFDSPATLELLDRLGAG